jgi:hypothetical protein
MNGFNPNFVLYYQSENPFKVTFNSFTTNNTDCKLNKHELISSGLANFTEQLFSAITD